MCLPTHATTQPNDETLIREIICLDDKKALATTVKMTQAVKATLEPNADLARLNPNRGTWERIEGRFNFVNVKFMYTLPFRTGQADASCGYGGAVEGGKIISKSHTGRIHWGGLSDVVAKDL